MKHTQPMSFPNRAQARFYVFISFVGGLIRNTSLLMLILCFSFAAAAAAVHTAKSFWNHAGVRSFVAALESDLADTGASDVDLYKKPPPHLKDVEKIQRDENRARRKLVKELRQPKDSAKGMVAVRQYGSKM